MKNEREIALWALENEFYNLHESMHVSIQKDFRAINARKFKTNLKENEKYARPCHWSSSNTTSQAAPDHSAEHLQVHFGLMPVMFPCWHGTSPGWQEIRDTYVS